MARKYEMMYVLSPAISDEELTALKERVHALLSSVGSIEKVDEMGRKRLAYEIEDHKEGVYELITFSAEAEAPKEIERVMNITDGVLRYLVVRSEE